MCLGVPAKVISVDGNMAGVEIGGVTYQARIDLLDEVLPGDYVILHAGFAIEKVDEAEAAETIRLFKEVLSMEDQEKDID
ncbi:MAG: HypC/HybG/HupF family hydrogenase formation chaperone [Bacteroidetes bacterium]|nr:HypC/HybG/HupF family hydrogenase formation chaperone [Bacteroidota bacterium]